MGLNQNMAMTGTLGKHDWFGETPKAGMTNGAFDKGSTLGHGRSKNDYLTQSAIGGYAPPSHNENLVKMLSRIDRAASYRLMEEIEQF